MIISESQGVSCWEVKRTQQQSSNDSLAQSLCKGGRASWRITPIDLRKSSNSVIAACDFLLLPNNTYQWRFRVQQRIKVAANNSSVCLSLPLNEICVVHWIYDFFRQISSRNQTCAVKLNLRFCFSIFKMLFLYFFQCKIFVFTQSAISCKTAGCQST